MTGPAVSERLAQRFAMASGVADAVLYEGYILYPYHAGHGKNQGSVRFQWGVLVPPAWRANDPYERSLCRTEMVLDPGSDPQLAVRVRFLRLQRRAVEVADPSSDSGFRLAPRLEAHGQVWVPWDEAIEVEIDLGVVSVLPLAGAARSVPFSFPATTEVELVPGDAPAGGTSDPAPAGRVLRTSEALEGEVRLGAGWANGPGVLVKVTVEVDNQSPWSDLTVASDEVMRRSLIAVHTLAALEDGSFCSVLDPPEGTAEAVAGCHSVGSYPVLVGPAGATDLVLASPIILYDYPALAPESEGDFHDGLEIDEILALRVLTLTDDEKAEARATDPRARAIIDRCDNMAPTAWDRLHGTLRDVRTLDPESQPVNPALTDAVPWWDPEVDAQFDPWTDEVSIGGIQIRRGARVRLHPRRRADVHDMFLAEQTATVAGVFNDLDGERHVAVTIDGDPAAEMFEFQGRFYYFHPEEVEPITDEVEPITEEDAAIGEAPEGAGR